MSDSRLTAGDKNWHAEGAHSLPFSYLPHIATCTVATTDSQSELATR